MIIQLHSTASGTPVYNSTALEWVHTGITGAGTDALLVFVGTVDAESPSISSVTYTGTPLQLIAETKGAGGESFPSGHILGLFNPTPPSGTIVVTFDETVGVLNGFSVVVSGLDTVGGSLNQGSGGLAVATQLPDFEISNSYIVAQSGILFDLCVSQSSRHTQHFPGGDQVKIADVPLAGSKFSVSYRLVNSGTEVVTISRDDCGGPFAGVSLTTAQLKGL